jgi:hypothetical protein
MTATPEQKAAGNRARALRETIGRMSTAARVHKHFAGGRPTNELRTVQEAIWVAKALDRQLRDSMAANGLNPDDSRVLVCYLTPDLSMLFTEPFFAGKEQALHAKLASTCCIMAGLIYVVRERDPKVLKEHGNDDLCLMGTKPFLNTKLVNAALNERIETAPLGPEFGLN